MTEIAIAHDQFTTIGGAERVALEISRAVDAPIYAMEVDQNLVPDDVAVESVATRRGRWMNRRHNLLKDAYQMLAWQHVPELHEYSTIIQTKNNPGWYVPCVDYQTVVRYCHTPPRTLYDQFHRRGGGALTDAIKTIQRQLYEQTVSYADRWVANSDVVARRIERYVDPSSADVEIVYPPVETARTSPDYADTQKYLFHIGRLAVNKRIDLLKDVATAVDVPVIVAGSGPYKDKLVAQSPKNLHYLGEITDREKWRRYSEAAATLFLGENEDFGIVPIESMAGGTPVIGVDEGFTKHQVKQGKNGYLAEPTLQSVVDAIEQFNGGGVAWSDRQIAEFASQFNVGRFHEQIREQIAIAQQEATVDPELDTPKKVVADD